MKKLKCKKCGHAVPPLGTYCTKDAVYNIYTECMDGLIDHKANNEGLCPYHTSREENEDEKM